MPKAAGHRLRHFAAFAWAPGGVKAEPCLPPSARSRRCSPLTALGRLLRARDFPAAAFWPAAERLVYFVPVPALLFLTRQEGCVGVLRGWSVLPCVRPVDAAHMCRWL
jgi:hypothetical protein